KRTLIRSCRRNIKTPERPSWLFYRSSLRRFFHRFLGLWLVSRAVPVEQRLDLLIRARLRRNEGLNLRGILALQFGHSFKDCVDSLEPASERGHLAVYLSIRRDRDLCQLLDGDGDLPEAVLDAREPECMAKLRPGEPIYGFFDGHFTTSI